MEGEREEGAAVNTWHWDKNTRALMKRNWPVNERDSVIKKTSKMTLSTRRGFGFCIFATTVAAGIRFLSLLPNSALE